MGCNDHVDFDLNERVEDLVASGELLKTVAEVKGQKPKRNPVYGITQQVIDCGYESLSMIQRETFDRFVIPALERQHSEREKLRFNLSND